MERVAITLTLLSEIKMEVIMGIFRICKGLIKATTGIVTSDIALIGSGVKDAICGGIGIVVGTEIKEIVSGSEILTNSPVGDFINGVKDLFDV